MKTLLLILLLIVHAEARSEILFSSPTDQTVNLASPESPQAEAAKESQDASAVSKCAGEGDPLQEEHKSLIADIAKVIGKYNDTKDPSGDLVNKSSLVVLTNARLCLEMRLFESANGLNFSKEEFNCDNLNACLEKNKSEDNFHAGLKACSSIAIRLPDMRMELIKNSDFSSVDELVTEQMYKHLGYLKQRIKTMKGSTQYLENVSAEAKEQHFAALGMAEKELLCWQEPLKCEESMLEIIEHQKSKFHAQIRTSPKFTIYVKHQGQLYPFKENSDLIVQSQPGPKLSEGSESNPSGYRTPEGTFALKLDHRERDSEYFMASHVDYESWTRSNNSKSGMLKDIPGADSPKKGGAVMIHGAAGASSGCLVFNNTDAAYAVMAIKAQKKTPEIDIYPAEMTAENLESLTTSPFYKDFKPFWEQLKEKAWDNNQKLKVSNIKTIDEILDH